MSLKLRFLWNPPHVQMYSFVLLLANRRTWTSAADLNDNERSRTTEHLGKACLIN